KALGDQKATGPRETADLMFVTWLEDKERLRVHFRTKVSDGKYNFVGGGARPDFPLPLPPIKDGAIRGGLRQLPPPPIKDGLRQPPPPPREEFKVRVGTMFGVEFGAAYEVAKDGKLVAIDA